MEFLLFERFISVPVLIVIYYIGVLAIPLLLFKTQTYWNEVLSIFTYYFPLTSGKIRLWLFILFIAFQILWRMMFEMIIAYFQIHESLQKLTF